MAADERRCLGRVELVGFSFDPEQHKSLTIASRTSMAPDSTPFISLCVIPAFAGMTHKEMQLPAGWESRLSLPSLDVG